MSLCALYPCHVHLDECRASPLPGFEHDESYREAFNAVFFKKCRYVSLWRVEYKIDYASGALVAYVAACGTPVFEVVTCAQAVKAVGVGDTEGIFGIAGH